jgi:hypothetical protein
MKNPRFVLVFGWLALMLVSPSAYPQDKAAKPSSIETNSFQKQLDTLVSTNRDLRVQTAIDLDTQRNELIKGLMAILDGTNSPKVKVDAVIVLGEYRASDAVHVLVQHLEWDDAARGGFSNGRIRQEEFEEKFIPVSIALEKIGMEAIPELLERTTQTDDTNILAKCVSICQRIEGQDVTQFRLHGLLDKETDSKKKERIQAAINALKQLTTEK